jgi:hypothetical protein
MTKSIFAGLPNDIIMKIIRETKTSIEVKQDHQDEFFLCMFAIEDVGEEYNNEHNDSPATDQFFCAMFHNEELTNTVSSYRRNRPRTTPW